MKKLLGFVLASVLAFSTCIVVFAAPASEEPSVMSIAQDGKTHKVYVFGTALALVSTEGSIDISYMGPVGRIDVMVDGNVTKNVASISIPTGQKTKMALEEGSIIVKNVTAESGEAIKKQIEDAYAAGVESIDLASLSGVTAYKINQDGSIENAAGSVVSDNAVGMSVTSVETTAKTFGETMEQIIAEDNAREVVDMQSSPADAANNNADETEEDIPVSTPANGSVSGNSIN